MCIHIQVAAHEILRQNKSAGRATTPLQFIKPAYLAHGWHLAFYGDPLFNDNIEAWEYGPVFPHLYREVRHFRNGPIDVNLFADVVVKSTIPENAQHVINEVMRIYGEYTAGQLIGIAYREGTPWEKTPLNAIVDNALIKNHFEETLQKTVDSNQHP